MESETAGVEVDATASGREATVESETGRAVAARVEGDDDDDNALDKVLGRAAAARVEFELKQVKKQKNIAIAFGNARI